MEIKKTEEEILKIKKFLENVDKERLKQGDEELISEVLNAKEKLTILTKNIIKNISYKN